MNSSVLFRIIDSLLHDAHGVAVADFDDIFNNEIFLLTACTF
jgi:hypothetical protein